MAVGTAWYVYRNYVNGTERVSYAPLAMESGQVEAVKVHHLDPGRDKVLHELFLRTLPSIDFSKSP